MTKILVKKGRHTTIEYLSFFQVVERRKQIEIEEQEIRRKEKELMSTVKLPAEAEAYKVQTIAEGKRTQTVEAARAEAERVRLTGAAEARAIEAVGRAEAESMRMKASAYKQYGDAAIMSLVLEALPQIAAEVAVSQLLLSFLCAKKCF